MNLEALILGFVRLQSMALLGRVDAGTGFKGTELISPILLRNGTGVNTMPIKDNLRTTFAHHKIRPGGCWEQEEVTEKDARLNNGMSLTEQAMLSPKDSWQLPKANSSA